MAGDLLAKPEGMESGSALRTAWLAANINGACWAFGNGLVSTTLITYFAQELGARGLQVSWIIAAPQLAGLMRLATPWLLELTPNRKRLAFAGFVLSASLLLWIPLLCRRGFLGSPQLSLNVLSLLWTAWHVAMYMALIPFFSWLGDLSTRENRSRCFAVRETWMTIATIFGALLAAGLLTTISKLNGYTVAALLGGLAILVSAVPLCWMPNLERRAAEQGFTRREMLAALSDRSYWPLLAFNITFSLANGFTAAAVGIYPYKIGVTATIMLLCQCYLRTGQAVAAPAMNRVFHTWGHRIPMAMAQALVAAGLLFYIMANAQEPWWIWGAWSCWIAYVVLNIALPHLMLTLSPGENSPSYIAVNMAANGVAFALSSVLGGWLLDLYRGTAWSIYFFSGNEFHLFLVAGLLLRLLPLVWLPWLPEPSHHLSANHEENSQRVKE